MILVDSDVLIEIVDKKSEKGEQALKLILASGEEMYTSSISLHEILFGLQKKRKPTDELLIIPVLDYTKADAELSSKMELDLEKKGTLIERTDIMMAAIAVNHGFSLFTYNKKHFAHLKPQGLILFEE